jgi:glycosyltransferase involved in cell wall biosynthesis
VNLRDISVIVTTFNESTNIARCLENLDGFGETMIVDSFSVDDTLDIGRSHSATIFSRPYQSAAKQKKLGH